ncbi:Hypothetical_protein [Hexamita inflata]|uniref:Hypothetical_protein n=1 Tax=Hexamita inflata TaxID=28002 RepID=A0ABP1K4T0_9EUKA
MLSVDLEEQSLLYFSPAVSLRTAVFLKVQTRFVKVFSLACKFINWDKTECILKIFICAQNTFSASAVSDQTRVRMSRRSLYSIAKKVLRRCLANNVTFEGMDQILNYSIHQ